MPSEDVGAPLQATGLTKPEILRTQYAMVTLSSVFVLARLIFQATRRKKLELQDYILYFSFACYLGACSLYITYLPILFKIQDITTGVAPMPADFMQTAGLVSRYVWSAQMCFYACLWSVKISLLCLYRKLLVGLPLVYDRIWWALVALCLVTYIGCVVSSITSCKNMPAFLATSECYSPEEYRAQTISLFLSYALDVFTDILVMALPICLVWNLQMPRRQRVAICALFASGLICIAFATIRVVQIGINDKGQASTPEPKWMTLWSAMELSIAIVIGCCPVFAALISTRRKSKRGSPHEYVKHSGGSSSKTGSVSLKLNTMISSKPRNAKDDKLYGLEPGSQEELALSPSNITVTTELHQHKSVTALPDKA